MGSCSINARAEIDHEKPGSGGRSSRVAARADLGVLRLSPTQKIGRSGKPLKLPFYLHRKDDGVLALAGLYEFWLDRARPDGDPDAWLTSFTIMTTTATDDCRPHP